MPSKIMDQSHLSQFRMPSSPSSFFSEELYFPSERQVGFWKADSVPDPRGTEGMQLMSGSKPVSSSPLEKLHPMGGNTVECLELSQAYVFKDQKPKISLEHHLMGVERTTGLSMTSWRTPNQDFGSRSSVYVQPASQFVDRSKVDLNGFRYENGLFSSSLSEIFNKKLSLSASDVPFAQSVDTTNFNFGDDEPFESLEEIEAQTIGNLLPDDEDLLSGIIDDCDYIARPNNGDDIEDMEDDLFCSVGGMELEADNNLDSSKASDFVGGGLSSPFAGEHPHGEHPSRTLFVRNINSNVEDAELRDLFEQYGDIRTLYTACKHRGFVMISYYDIRAARNALRALQNKPLRRRKLDIHFSIPKDNPSEKDINQGTLVVFNLDSSVSNDDLRQIFGVYGEVKEIRETPHKHHHKFVEFYDVRASEAALRALNKSDIAGKIIKLEPSRPGGARRCLMQQLSPELDQEDSSGCRQGSPPCHSPSECFGSVTLGENTFNGLDNVAIQGLHSAARAPVSPFMETTLHGISSSVPHSLSSPARVATVGSHSNQPVPDDLSHSLGHMNFSYKCTPTFHPHSLPEYHGQVINGMPFNAPSTMDIINSRPVDGIENRHIHRVDTGSLNSHSFEHHEGAFGVLGNGNCPLHGHQYVWNNSDLYHHHPPGTMMWQNSPSFVNSIPSHPPQMHGFPRAPSHMLNTIPPLHHHHVGSAPSVNPSPWDRRHAYAGDSMETSAFHPASLGNLGFPASSPLHPLELASRNIFSHAGGNSIDPSLSSAHVGIPSPQQRCHVFHGRNMLPGSYDVPNERVRSRRSDATANQADNKKQYELDIGCIRRGEDSRTTLMIKNIPNKYTSKMLLATIDEHHRGTYDFIYLPIDFKNKCNVGYAFINMIDPQHIIPFFQVFNGKKWEKFNSEKVASLAYARIQGRPALIAHFQNSSLMNEDKRCRPILFHTDGPKAGDQEPFPMGVNIRSRPGRSRTAGNEETHQGSPTSANGEEPSNATDTSSSSTKDP